VMASSGGRFTMVERWDPLSAAELAKDGDNNFYDKATGPNRRRIDPMTFPLETEEGTEIAIYNTEGKRIARREAHVIDGEEGRCGVLMNLETVQGFFNPDPPPPRYDDDPEEMDSVVNEGSGVDINVYPLGYLRTIGNVQANGVPHCLYRKLTEVNQKVRNDPNPPSPMSDGESSPRERSLQAAAVVKPICSQFYNYFSHRAAARAGALDSEQGTVTAAIAGSWAQTTRDKLTAWGKRRQCETEMPSDAFHRRIELPACPTACRGEVVYTVDVRNLNDNSGR
jgi:hypothetical protein